ncbi:hypothetical protein TB1_024978 [Malus domestica]
MKSRIRACVMGKGRKLTCTREGFKLAGKRGDEACTFGPVACNFELWTCIGPTRESYAQPIKQAKITDYIPKRRRSIYHLDSFPTPESNCDRICCFRFQKEKTKKTKHFAKWLGD